MQIRGYTILHGHELDEAIEKAFEEAAHKGAKLLLASHSVARRLAPFVRIAGEQVTLMLQVFLLLVAT